MLAEGTEGNQTIKWTVDPGYGQGSETRGPSRVPCTRVFPRSPKKKKRKRNFRRPNEAKGKIGPVARLRFGSKINKWRVVCCKRLKI